MVDGFGELEKRVAGGKMKVAKYISSLQQPNGTFAGDEWGETDTRFLYGALNALSLLNLLPNQQPDHPPLINVAAGRQWWTERPPHEASRRVLRLVGGQQSCYGR